jgi:hypothetical protein
VTSVTVPTESDAVICIHPYPIDTEDSSVIRDLDNNTLYFPVTNDDVIRGYKRYLAHQHHLVPVDNFRHSSFRLTRNKILQSELKSYESLRIFDSSEYRFE